jgi:hypothetical protein
MKDSKEAREEGLRPSKKAWQRSVIRAIDAAGLSPNLRPMVADAEIAPGEKRAK